MVGAGTFNFVSTRRDEAKMIPRGVEWIRDYATTFEPEKNRVNTKANGPLTYDYLIISAEFKMILKRYRD